MGNRQTSGSSISFPALLTILFIALKLIGVIDWHWLWVLSPLWIGWGLLLISVMAVLSVTTVVVMGAGIAELMLWLGNKKEKRNEKSRDNKTF